MNRIELLWTHFKGKHFYLLTTGCITSKKSVSLVSHAFVFCNWRAHTLEFDHSVECTLTGRAEDGIEDIGGMSGFAELIEACSTPFEQVEPGNTINLLMIFYVHVHVHVDCYCKKVFGITK